MNTLYIRIMGLFFFIFIVVWVAVAVSIMGWFTYGDMLVYTSFRGDVNIHMLDLRTGLEYSLPDTEAAYYPVWSPDGNRLAFVQKQGDFFFSERASGTYFQLYLMDMRTFRSSQVTREIANVAHPAWSPDGMQIAFTSFIEVDSTIYTLNVSDSTLQQRTQNDAVNSNPVWHPDGSLAFRSKYQDGYATYVIENDTVRRFSQIPVGVITYDWSPDSTLLTYAAKVSEDDRDIAILDLTTGEQRLITSSMAQEINPVWSPDGRRIAFTSYQTGNGDIYVVDVHTGNIRRLTTSDSADTNPAWFPRNH